MHRQIRKSLLDWQRIVDRLTICKDNVDKNVLMQNLIARQQTCVLTFMNAHAANIAWKDRQFADFIISSDVILRDGIGMHLLLHFLGRDAGLNLNGTDFIPELLKLMPKNKILAVFGTQEPHLGAGIAHLKAIGYDQIHAEHGFHEDRYYVVRCADIQPSVVLLAMGMPKQERVALLLKRAATRKKKATLIINGGAIIDFFANRYPRAPLWIRRNGMEWAYRMIKEPKRLWRRNVGNFIFVLRALLVSAFHQRS